jgi:hypothetical protein
MTPADVIRKMRKFVADRSLNERTTFLGGVVKEWADALEAAMREPVGWVFREHFPTTVAIGPEEYTTDKKVADMLDPYPVPVFAIPQDLERQLLNSQAEIERLTNALRTIQCACIMPRPGVVGAVMEIARDALAATDLQHSPRLNPKSA